MTKKKKHFLLRFSEFLRGWTLLVHNIILIEKLLWCCHCACHHICEMLKIHSKLFLLFALSL